MKRKYTTQQICILGLLAALAVILAMLTTYRPIPIMKFSLKFIPVFIAGFLYGPFSAGIISAIGDFINASVTTGVNPFITMVEFLCGFVFGLCFYKSADSKFYYLRAFICAFIQLVIALTLMSWILLNMGIGHSFVVNVISRLPEKLIIFVLQMAVMCGGKKLVFKIKKSITKDGRQ